MGILNDIALVAVLKENNQAAGSIVYENLCKMWARLADPCAANAVWIANKNVVPQLLTMGITLGVGGAPVYQPAGGAAAAPNGTLFGRPLLFSEKAPALGSKGDILLCDLGEYAIGLRKEVSIDRSIHVGWHRDQTHFRGIVRVDGMGTWGSALTPKAGDSLSWCVCIEARA